MSLTFWAGEFRIVSSIMVNEQREIWQAWVQFLHRWGLGDLAASFLETFGPLTTLAAQVIYVGQPVLQFVLPENYIQALTCMMEDERQKEKFISMLREAPTQ